MKTLLPSLKAATCLLLILNSCTSSKNTLQTTLAPTINPRSEVACFVEMNDGTIKNFNSLKLVTGVFKTPHLLADDSVFITADQIKVYQNKEHYAVSQKEFTVSKMSYVAVDALPGFAVRVAKGKLNVYALKFYNGHNTTEKFFLQNGEDGPIVAYTPELMKEMIKDNTEALTFFGGKNKDNTLPKKILGTADLYNNPRDVSKN